MHVKSIQGRSEYRSLSRKDRGKCAVQGFKLRYTAGYRCLWVEKEKEKEKEKRKRKKGKRKTVKSLVPQPINMLSF
jgi:hypothetical protein